jgi:hypothetical protein
MDDQSVLRQSEINEWYYHLKLESLFISQLCFLGLSFGIILFSLSQAGLFGPTLVYYYLFLLFIFLGIVWLTRFLYTRNNRDKRFWNRKIFNEDNNKSSTIPNSVIRLRAEVAGCTVNR